jgi:hypothetical protein
MVMIAEERVLRAIRVRNAQFSTRSLSKEVQAITKYKPSSSSWTDRIVFFFVSPQPSLMFSERSLCLGRCGLACSIFDREAVGATMSLFLDKHRKTVKARLSCDEPKIESKLSYSAAEGWEETLYLSGNGDGDKGSMPFPGAVGFLLLVITF